jgi:hypothetical protein
MVFFKSEIGMVVPAPFSCLNCSYGILRRHVCVRVGVRVDVGVGVCYAVDSRFFVPFCYLFRDVACYAPFVLCKHTVRSKPHPPSLSLSLSLSYRVLLVS